MMLVKFIKSDDGNSLVSILVLLGVSIGMLGAITSKVNHGFKSQLHSEIISEIDMIANYIENNLDCSRTVDPIHSVCIADPSLPIILQKQNASMTTSLAKSGPLSGSGKVFGNWYIKSSCESNSLVIKAAKYRKGNFVKDPLTNKLVDFSNNRALFGGNSGRKLCETELTGEVLSAASATCITGTVRYRNRIIEYCNASNDWTQTSVLSSKTSGDPIVISGSGDVTIDAALGLSNIQITGSGNVSIFGTPGGSFDYRGSGDGVIASNSGSVESIGSGDISSSQNSGHISNVGSGDVSIRKNNDKIINKGSKDISQ